MVCYTFKFSLKDSIQETSRTVNVPSDINFEKLHEIIQTVFGFDDYHNYSFELDAKESTKDYYDTINMTESKNIYIKDYVENCQKMIYWYDFGDDWLINMDLINKKEETLLIPELIKIKGRYNPVEDCGGIMVFNTLLYFRKNKKSLKPFLEYEKEFRSINKVDTQNKLRVLFGYDELERPKKKVKPVNTLDKYFK